MNNPVRAAIPRHCEAPRLLRMGGPMRGGRALDVGCGRGVGTELILDVFGADSVDAFDLDLRMVARARTRLAAHGSRVRCGSAMQAPSACRPRPTMPSSTSPSSTMLHSGGVHWRRFTACSNQVACSMPKRFCTLHRPSHHRSPPGTLTERSVRLGRVCPGTQRIGPRALRNQGAVGLIRLVHRTQVLTSKRSRRTA
jgi:Methyltransferase domain